MAGGQAIRGFRHGQRPVQAPPGDQGIAEAADSEGKSQKKQKAGHGPAFSSKSLRGG
jgi:hypothetical protein